MGKLTSDQAADKRNVDVFTVYTSCIEGHESLPWVNEAQRCLPSMVLHPKSVFAGIVAGHSWHMSAGGRGRTRG
jgi:hypothetical protein